MGTLWGLQYLRAAAALSVLLFHAMVGAGRHDAVGTGGVDIFFVLSGFLMFQIASANPRPLAFFSARIKRIVPAYWLVTALVVASQLVGLTEQSSFDPVHALKSLLFIPSMDVGRGEVYPLLIVGWTLNYEMFFYAIVTGVLLAPHRARLPLLGLVFVALTALRQVSPAPPVWLAFYSDPIIFEFLFGAVLAHLWDKGLLPRYGAIPIALGTVLMIAPQPDWLHRVIGYGVPAALIVLGVLALETQRRLAKAPILALLGDASYSIYLWHLFAVTVAFRLAGSTPPAFAAAMFGGVALGLASYFMIERPVMSAFARKRSPSPQADFGLGNT